MPIPARTPAIRLRGVRHNNLKGFDLDLPLHRLIVITGLSGSGKSSLAFDTLYAEGQRRYIETFSPYARQFFDRMDKPRVDRISGIPPAIAIEQRNAVRSTRSTVGTMTEICDYMKLLWPHVAQLHCRQCGKPVRKEPPQFIWETLQSSSSSFSSSSSKSRDRKTEDEDENEGRGRNQLRELLITFTVPLSEKLPLTESLALIAKQGYQRLFVNGDVVRLEDAGHTFTHHASRVTHLTVIQDRLKPAPASRARFIEACEQAYHFGKGKLAIHELEVTHHASRITRQFSAGLHCATCNLDYRDPSPALFSFNHPLGACPACKGFGRTISIDYDLAIPDRSLTLADGAVRPWRTGFSAECQTDMKKFCKLRKVPLDVPFNKMTATHQDWVLNGDPGYGTDKDHEWPRAWYGVKGYFRWLESKSYKMHVRVLLSRYRSYTTCETCKGARLNPDALLYRLAIGNRQSPITLADFYALSVRDALALTETISGSRSTKHAARDPLTLALHEVRSRLQYLADVGLSYLTLDRPTRTLSGGETERVNLTTCLGTKLVNTLYVLDEPSVGLHPRDTARLIGLLEQLRDHGNTVVVVEHESSVMRAADQIVDLGPGHGATGGELVFQGTFREILKSKPSLTGQYLSGRKRIEVPARRPITVTRGAEGKRGKGEKEISTPESHLPFTSSPFPPFDAWLKLTGASAHNLRDLTIAIPLNRFVVITGVSGSGKSTLVRDVLFPALTQKLGAVANAAKASDRIEPAEPESDDDSTHASRITHHISGAEHLARVLMVDQSALGKTPRSNPAVYTGAFEHIREVFAQSEVAKQRGLNASAFSFNSGVGQCERCRGAGFEKIEMQFLSDVFIRCPDCNGRRYRPHILEVKVTGDGWQVTGGEKSRITHHASRSFSIADTLEASVDEAVDFFSRFTDSKPAQRAVAALKLLQDVGLGYLALGQPINTLSGGESQRLKLAAHLAEAEESGSTQTPDPRRQTLFIFDEPTTGLHFEDVRVLLQVFQRLVDAGHSVLVIEHNLDVIKCADWVIDLGPEAGANGGQIVATGTPEDIAQCDASHTGRFLRDVLRVACSEMPSQIKTAVVRTRNTQYATRIAIHGAREHNLKNISLAIPRGKFVVVTGVSGSGKSTLAFDLIFAEGQRRFLDSMNAYARQFVEQMARPDVDLIDGLPPTVSIEQRTTRGGGKSTVATVTEIYHFVRLLFARLGTQYCPDCNVAVRPQTRDEVATQLRRELKQRGDLRLLAPMVKRRKGFHTDVAEWAAKHGYAEVRADGKLHPTSERLRLDRFKEHDVEIVVGTVAASRQSAANLYSSKVRRSAETPLLELIETTLDLGKGTLLALDKRGRITVHSTERVCPECNRSFELLDPKNFSYNSPAGWCPKCRGFGELFYIPDVERGANADSVEESWWSWAQEREVCPECHGARLNPVARAVRLLGAPISRSARSAGRYKLADREIGAPTIETFSALDVAAAAQMFTKLKFDSRSATIARDILPEIRERLRFLNEVGLGYLQLGRGVPTLSGGEGQRIRLAAQLGSNLSGVLYVLDEPTIGLHARDNEQLLNTLERLRSRGNSVLVVEHDEDTMRRADFVIDLGPGAGVHGGQVVASGTLKELMRHKESITGQSLRAQAEKKYPARGERRLVWVGDDVRSLTLKRRKPSERLLTSSPTIKWLTLHHAAKNNLRDLTVRVPLGRFVAVTGVSGSGKSTLIRECLLPALESALKVGRASPRAGAEGKVGSRGSRGRSPHLSGHETIAAVYEVDQSPIGRTPRSIPATYVGFFDDIRQLFALTPEARIRGYSASRFSFNSAQGRCPECEGAGVIKLEMNFLPPAFVKCETCNGSRFNRETLDIEYAGKNVAQVLDLSVEEALTFFAAHRKIHRALQALHDTGLDYIKLGQTSPTLSGGEAQRVKLVSHLLSGLRPGPDTLPSRFTQHASRNLFILEEPTIGLHMADVRRLVDVIQRLVDAGHSVIVIEHNLDLVAEADWVIDLGPEGGEGGGQIVCEGTPEVVARNKRSHTGRFLRSVLHQA